MEFHFLPNCVIYVDDSENGLCNYPCSLDHCTAETHHWTQCPVWNCYDKTTTTTESPSPTTAPDSSHSECSTALCIASVSINALLVVVGAVAVSVFLTKHFRRTRTRTGSPDFNNPLFDYFANENPIIRSRSLPARSETIPLLESSQRSVRFFNQLPETQTLPFHEALHSPLGRSTSSTASTTALNPSAPDLPYVEINF